MHKGVKKYNLNTSNKAHGKLLLRNLFTSLLLSGRLETTEKKAKSLKQYALKAVNRFKKIKSPITKKTWLQTNIITRKNYKVALENLDRIKDNFAVSIKRSRFRKGDGAVIYEVVILNFDEKKDV